MNIRLEVAENRALDGCGRIPVLQPPGQSLDAFLLQRTNRGADSAPQAGGIEGSSLPRPSHDQTLGGEPGSLMKHRQFASLAREFF